MESRRWYSVVNEVSASVGQRAQQLPPDFPAKRWILMSHRSCINLLEASFSLPVGSTPYVNIVKIFGQAFIDRVLSPSADDLSVLCSACYHGSAAINAAGDFPFDVIRELFLGGSIIYGRPTTYFANWLEFAGRERLAVQRGENTFSYNLGLRVCLEILLAFGLIDPQGQIGTASLDAWSKVWFKMICEVAKMTKESYQQ